MKKQSFAVLGLVFVLVLTGALVGCPQPPVEPPVEETVPVQIGLGISSLPATKAMTNDGLYQRLESMKSAAVQVSVVVYKQSVWDINGPYGNAIQSEYISLDENKQLVKPVLMPIGDYHIRVIALDTYRQQLFIADEDNVKIVVGMGPLSMTLQVLDQYTYEVTVNEMPGDFSGGWRTTQVMTNSGEEFYGYCYSYNGQVKFFSFLPVSVEWAGVIATDRYGDVYSFDIMFSPLQQTPAAMTYVAGSIATGVDGQLNFGFESQVICNGELYDSLQDALWSAFYNDAAADILLFEGVYEISDLYIPYGLSTTIKGQGTKTVLRNVDQYSGATHVIVASWDGPPEQAKGGGIDDDNFNISISDLVIENRSEVNRDYSDAALLFNRVNNVSLDNVVVLSANRGVVAKDCREATVNHCVLSTLGGMPVSGVEFSECNTGLSAVVNSVIDGFPLGIGYGPTDKVYIGFDCFWQYQVVTSQGVPRNCHLVDPQLDSNFLPLPGSCCLNTACDGGNIGLDY